MTVTIKLTSEMELQLRQLSAVLGQPASMLIRDVLAAYLASDRAGQASAYFLGVDLFGRHAADVGMASSRKVAVVDALERKAARRGSAAQGGSAPRFASPKPKLRTVGRRADE